MCIGASLFWQAMESIADLGVNFAEKWHMWAHHPEGFGWGGLEAGLDAKFASTLGNA